MDKELGLLDDTMWRACNITKKQGWFGKILWEYTIGSLHNYTEQIPLGIVLRMSEMKKLKLFNRFHIIAPTEKFRIELKDPIVVASVEKELWWAPKADRDQHRYYFVGKWD